MAPDAVAVHRPARLGHGLQALVPGRHALAAARLREGGEGDGARQRRRARAARRGGADRLPRRRAHARPRERRALAHAAERDRRGDGGAGGEAGDAREAERRGEDAAAPVGVGPAQPARRLAEPAAV